jgi:hypothetical protein
MGCILERHIFRAEFLVIPPSLINSLAFSAWYPARWLNRSEHTLQFPRCNLIRPRSQRRSVRALTSSRRNPQQHENSHSQRMAQHPGCSQHLFRCPPSAPWLCSTTLCARTKPRWILNMVSTSYHASVAIAMAPSYSKLLKPNACPAEEVLRQAPSVSDVQTTWSSRSGLSPARLGNPLRSDLSGFCCNPV